MRIKSPIYCALGLVLMPLLSACNRSAPESAAPPQPSAQVAQPAPVAPPSAAAAAPTVPGHFGAPLSDKAALPASALLTAPEKYDDKDVKLVGQVGGVCQNKGCWMTIGGGEPGQPTVRVSFKDYGFFVPRDALGKEAIVEGHFRVTTMSKEEAQHYADDAAKAGAPRKIVASPQRTLALVATGVELR